VPTPLVGCEHGGVTERSGSDVSSTHPLLERQWSFGGLAVLKLFFAVLGCALSIVAMMFFGGLALKVGAVAAVLLLTGCLLMGLAKTDHDLTVALRLLAVGAVIGVGPALYVRL
jgi:hypothetical protein